MNEHLIKIIDSYLDHQYVYLLELISETLILRSNVDYYVDNGKLAVGIFFRKPGRGQFSVGSVGDGKGKWSFIYNIRKGDTGIVFNY